MLRSASLALLLGGCKIVTSPDTSPASLVNECESDADCAEGTCDRAENRCARGNTEFKALLMEVVPPGSDQIYGGRHFFQRISTDTAPLDLVLPRQEVDGRINLWLGNCFGHTILFSLRPRVEALGLRPVRLGIESPTLPERVENGDFDYSLRLNRFTLSAVPAGKYDIYFRDSGYEKLSPECPAPAVPHLERGLSFASAELSVPYRLDQNIPEPVEVTIRVPWRDDLEGWTVDTVHNITGELMSTQATLRGALRAAEAPEVVTVSIRHAHVLGTDYRIPSPTGNPFSGGSFVRFRPPDPTTYPTIYLAGLITAEASGQIELDVPEIGPFSELVDYRAWVWGEGSPTTPVHGRVQLSARQLSDVSGTAATLTRTVDIAEDGSIQALLLPGIYVADVVPERESGYGRFRTEITVWDPPADSDAGAEQYAQMLAVPRAVQVSGSLRGPGGEDPTGTTVRVQASARGGFTLTAQVPRSFQPRATELIVDANGRFAVDVDCSSCTAETPASMDVVFAPAEGSELPWLIYRDLPVGADLDLGRVDLQVPRFLDGRVLFQNRPTQVPLPYSGPRVRAYALIDRAGKVVTDPALPDCIDVEPASDVSSAEACVQRVILIGEASTDQTGGFTLALPAAFGEFP